jgi:hypothetical protein
MRCGRYHRSGRQNLHRKICSHHDASEWRKILKTYKVALGSVPVGAKRMEGDHKTPEGDYQSDAKNSHSQFHLSLRISYPSAADQERARSIGARPGGAIMIHGLARPFCLSGASAPKPTGRMDALPRRTQKLTRYGSWSRWEPKLRSGPKNSRCPQKVFPLSSEWSEQHSSATGSRNAR